MPLVGDLDLTEPSINEAASVHFTYNVNSDVETITWTWLDEDRSETHTWTQTFTYNGTLVTDISAWVHAVS